VEDAAVKGPTWFVVLLVAGVAISFAGVLAGAWWLTFPAGMLVGAALPRARAAIPAGGLAGLLGWGLPLVIGQIRVGLGPAASSLAAAMGFTHQAAVPLILTCVIGVLLGLTGAWFASAVRGLTVPATR
jgi:hypothetical protein